MEELCPVPRRPLPVYLQCRLQTTSSLCQPRSSRRASPSSQQLWSAGFFCGRPCDIELVTRQSERSGHQQRLLQAFTKDIFIFSLLALELFGRCALQIYLLTLSVCLSIGKLRRPEPTERIFVKILSQMYPRATKSPLKFGNRPDLESPAQSANPGAATA